MLSRLAVPHLTEVNRAFGVVQPEAKSNQMFRVKPRDCQAARIAPQSSCSSSPVDGNSGASRGPRQSEAPSGSCDATWGHGAFSLGSSWWQRDMGTRDFEQEE